MTDFIIQNSISRQLLVKEGLFRIFKTTRVGSTISLIKNAIELGKPTVVIQPTIRLIHNIKHQIESLLSSKPKTATILSNFEMCQRLPKKSEMKFLFKPSCWNCKYNSSEECKLQEILNNEFDLYFLTHQKLRVLHSNPSSESRRLLKKLIACKVFIFDEFARIILSNQPVLQLKNSSIKDIELQLRNQIDNIFPVKDGETTIILELFLSTIDVFLNQIINLEEEGVYPSDTTLLLSDDDVQFSFRKLWAFTNYLSEKGVDTKLVQDLLLLSSFREFILTIRKGNYTITGRVVDALDHIKKFVNRLDKRKTIFLVDSYQPQLDCSKIFDRPIHDVIWGDQGDPLGNNRFQLIISDTSHWSSLTFQKDKRLRQRIKEFLKTLTSKFDPSLFFILTTNKSMAVTISKWNLPQGILVSWFRSTLTRGMPLKGKKILVCINGPFIPMKSYVAQSKNFSFNDFSGYIGSLSSEERDFRISQILKIDDVKSEFTNSIGRIKSPLGEFRSLVFCLGMNESDVKSLLAQKERHKITTPYIVKPILRGGFMRDSPYIAQLWLDQDSKTFSIKNTSDLPLLARIIRLSQEKTHLRLSEVIPRKTLFVKKIARANYPILQYYGVRLRKTQGGYFFEKTK